MDALIYGYSNFTFTPPTSTTTTAVISEVANAPMAFDETANRFTPAPTPVFITPTLETVKPEAIPTVTPIYEDDVRRLAPIRPEVSPSPFIIPDDVRPAPAPTPAPSPFIPIIDIIDTKPTYVKPTLMDSVPYHEPISYQSAPISIAEDDGRRTVAPTPIINIISPSPYVAPALNTEVGGALGGGALSRGAMGGGGGAMGGGSKPSSTTPTTDAKPSFLKKNFIPLVLVASAIFVFIKKPIK